MSRKLWDKPRVRFGCGRISYLNPVAGHSFLAYFNPIAEQSTVALPIVSGPEVLKVNNFTVARGEVHAHLTRRFQAQDYRGTTSRYSRTTLKVPGAEVGDVHSSAYKKWRSSIRVGPRIACCLEMRILRYRGCATTSISCELSNTMQWRRYSP